MTCENNRNSPLGEFLTALVSLDQALSHLRNDWSEHFNVHRDSNTGYSVKFRFIARANEMPPEEIIDELRSIDEVSGLSIGASGSYGPPGEQSYSYRVKGHWAGDL